MFFTQEDYKKIQQWLVKNSVKDTEFNEANIPFNGEETITIVQGNQNKKVFLKDLVAQIFNLGVSDFVNITDKYDAPNINLEEAIRFIPSRARKEGQVITFLDRENHWHIYQFKGVLNQWNVLDTWEDLFDWEKLIIDSILPDEEDLTKSEPDANGNSYLSLKDRAYNPEDFSGLGRIILRKNIVEIEDPIYGKVKKNILYQDMINKENTIYEIRYDFDLNGSEITIPEGCVLEFQGGSFSNGSIIGNFTNIKAPLVKIFELSVTLEGSWNLERFYINWYGANPNLDDNTTEIKKTIDFCIKTGVEAFVPNGDYLLKSTLFVIDAAYRIDYPFPLLNELKIKGEPMSKLKASSLFTDESLIMMGDDTTKYHGQLYLDTITLDGSNKEISLVNAVPAWQARFYADNCSFVGITGLNSYAINSLNSSVWLKNCVLEGYGDYRTNGIGVVAKYTTIEMIDCFVSYFREAIRITRFSESTITARDCLFQINKYNIAYEGGNYLNNTSTFTGCYFVETKPEDKHFECLDKTGWGSWGVFNFIGCQFDNYSKNAEFPVIDLNFNNYGGTFNFIGCNAWTSTAPEGFLNTTNVIINAYVKAKFIGCDNLNVISNNNPEYAKFAEYMGAGSSPGKSISGVNIRKLNAPFFNQIPSLVLNNHTITIPKGVYKISAKAVCYGGGSHQLFLFNKTDNVSAIPGTTCFASQEQTIDLNDKQVTILGSQNETSLSGYITVSKTTEFTLNHKISIEHENGLGKPCITEGVGEVYSQIEIWKEA